MSNDSVILVLNAGSSSLKFSLFAVAEQDLQLESRGQIEGLLGDASFVAKSAAGTLLAEQTWPAQVQLDHEKATAFLLTWLMSQLAGRKIIAVGHRVVHGGPDFAAPVLINEQVIARLEALIPLAPLHNPHNLAPIKALRLQAPHLPQVACFDTAFHRTQPWLAQTFAIPRKLTEEGVQRYGFHGLSYQFIAGALKEVDPAAAAGRTVVAHLGNGASLCALHAGRSVATTMGLTTLDGLMMGTRCGNIDPGVLLYLMDQHHMGPRELERLLYKESGLLGVSGIGSDMRTLLASSEPAAEQAVSMFVYRAQLEIAAMAAAMQGLDAIVFTGGIGEHARDIRARILQGLAWLGVDLDSAQNTANGPSLTSASSKIRAWVIPTHEEKMIAQATQTML